MADETGSSGIAFQPHQANCGFPNTGLLWPLRRRLECEDAPPSQGLPNQASPTASSFLGVDIGGFDTWIEVESRPQSLTPPTLTVCTQAPLPLSILMGQADGGFSLVHSNDSALPQEQTKGTWETGCLERPGLGTRALFQPSARRGGKYSVAFLPLRSGSGQMEGDGT